MLVQKAPLCAFRCNEKTTPPIEFMALPKHVAGTKIDAEWWGSSQSRVTRENM